jgi:hypothetical protein
MTKNVKCKHQPVKWKKLTGKNDRKMEKSYKLKEKKRPWHFFLDASAAALISQRMRRRNETQVLRVFVMLYTVQGFYSQFLHLRPPSSFEILSLRLLSF